MSKILNHRDPKTNPTFTAYISLWIDKLQFEYVQMTQKWITGLHSGVTKYWPLNVIIRRNKNYTFWSPLWLWLCVTIVTSQYAIFSGYAKEFHIFIRLKVSLHLFFFFFANIVYQNLASINSWSAIKWYMNITLKLKFI